MRAAGRLGVLLAVLGGCTTATTGTGSSSSSSSSSGAASTGSSGVVGVSSSVGGSSQSAGASSRVSSGTSANASSNAGSTSTGSASSTAAGSSSVGGTSSSAGGATSQLVGSSSAVVVSSSLGGGSSSGGGVVGPEDNSTACQDGFDNDGDTYVDCVDFNCRGVSPCNAREDTPALCVDGFDNDGDTYVDCVDFNCRPLSVCRTTEDAPDTCKDGVDNDNDNALDCADTACMALSVCATTETAADTCTDGADNDGDQLTDCADPGCAAVPACNVTSIRVATWNIQVLEAPGTAAYNAVLDIVRRVDAQVICFNEIEELENNSVAALATAAGYPNRFIGNVSSALAGGIKNGCLSRLPMVEGVSLTSEDISTDPNAHETGRDIVRVRVQAAPGKFLTILSVHLKSGFDTSDEVRRQVEMVRAVQALQQQEARYPQDGFILMGDFNEEIDGGALGHVYTTPPATLPQSWNLGNDLAFPITYQPFAMAAQAGLAAADVTQEDSTTFYATRIPSGRRIDYVMFKALSVAGDEVYNPCRDNGMDDAPVGNWLAKAGNPVACGLDETASDHRPVMVDFVLP